MVRQLPRNDYFSFIQLQQSLRFMEQRFTELERQVGLHKIENENLRKGYEHMSDIIDDLSKNIMAFKTMVFTDAQTLLANVAEMNELIKKIPFNLDPRLTELNNQVLAMTQQFHDQIETSIHQTPVPPIDTPTPVDVVPAADPAEVPVPSTEPVTDEAKIPISVQADVEPTEENTNPNPTTPAEPAAETPNPSE